MVVEAIRDWRLKELARIGLCPLTDRHSHQATADRRVSTTKVYSTNTTSLRESHRVGLVRYETHHPFGHRGAVVILLQTGNALAVDLLAQRLLTNVEQGS